MADFNPNLQTNLKHELAQGANVGDRRTFNGATYRWDGNSWTQSGGEGYTSSSGGGISMDDIINQAITRYREANKPAVESLQAGIPETQAKYAQLRTQGQARIEPLKARYNNLLGEVKNYYLGQEQQQTKVTAAEMAKRGILPSSTLSQQEIASAVRPITSEAAYKTTDLGYQREDAIKQIEDYVASLGPQEVEELRLARNAIAQLQSGAANSGISTGIDIYKQRIAEEQQARAERMEKERLAKQNELLSSLFGGQTTQATSTGQTNTTPQNQAAQSISNLVYGGQSFPTLKNISSTGFSSGLQSKPKTTASSAGGGGGGGSWGSSKQTSILDTYLNPIKKLFGF